MHKRSIVLGEDLLILEQDGFYHPVLLVVKRNAQRRAPVLHVRSLFDRDVFDRWNIRGDIHIFASSVDLLHVVFLSFELLFLFLKLRDSVL